MTLKEFFFLSFSIMQGLLYVEYLCYLFLSFSIIQSLFFFLLIIAMF
jgi:hypothetical protein